MVLNSPKGFWRSLIEILLFSQAYSSKDLITNSLTPFPFAFARLNALQAAATHSHQTAAVKLGTPNQSTGTRAMETKRDMPGYWGKELVWIHIHIKGKDLLMSSSVYPRPLTNFGTINIDDDNKDANDASSPPPPPPTPSQLSLAGVINSNLLSS
jgi:hypothetical protein